MAQLRPARRPGTKWVKSPAPAPTTEQATKNSSRTTRRGDGSGTGGGENRVPTGRVSPPSGSFETYNEGNMFRVSVPSNWREVQDTNSVTFAPDGAFGS